MPIPLVSRIYLPISTHKEGIYPYKEKKSILIHLIESLLSDLSPYSLGVDGRKKIARRIRELRRLRGLSQEQLAEKSGTGAKYLSRVETGRENPTLDLLLRIAKGLNVEPYELLAFEKGTPRELRKRLNALIAEARDEDLQRLLKIVEGFLHSE